MSQTFNMFNNIPITNTLKAISNSIVNAEQELKEQVKTHYHEANEEILTFMFYSHIKHNFKKLNDLKTIEQEFFKDLKNATRSWNLRGFKSTDNVDKDLHQKASGLIAEIVLHNKQEEGKSGGDFGLVVIHPIVTHQSNSHGNEVIEIKKGGMSGLLCQAKLKSKTSKWGKLTDNQSDVLKDRLDYTSIVLYSYDDINRSELNPILWSICKGKSISALEEMLKEDKIDNMISTGQVIVQLGKKSIGTTNKKIIEEIISASAWPSLEIKIKWKNDNNYDPGGTITIKNKQATTQQQQEIKQQIIKY